MPMVILYVLAGLVFALYTLVLVHLHCTVEYIKEYQSSLFRAVNEMDRAHKKWIR